MKLIEAKIVGFQSFADSGLIAFSNGINLVIGQNNAGKSALLRALRPNLADDRHRSPERWSEAELPRPIVTLKLDVSGAELRIAMLNSSQSFIPVPTNSQTVAFMNAMLSKEQVVVTVEHTVGGKFTTNYPGHGLFEPLVGHTNKAAVVQSSDGALQYTEAGNRNDSMGDLSGAIWNNKLFYFSPERMNVGESIFGNDTRLAHNARISPRSC